MIDPYGFDVVTDQPGSPKRELSVCPLINHAITSSKELNDVATETCQHDAPGVSCDNQL